MEQNNQNDSNSSSKNDLFKVEIILRLISSGIVKSFQDWEKTGVSNVLYNKQLQRGLDQLIAFCLTKRIEFPRHVPEILEWCELPFSRWQLPSLPDEVSPEDSFLINQQPSFFCLDYAQSDSTNESALSEERYMQKVFIECNGLAPNVYTALREMLVRKPVINESDLVQTYLMPPLNAIPELVKEAYEEAPLFLSHKGIFKCCPKCSNLLMFTLDKEWICRDESCDLKRLRNGAATIDFSTKDKEKVYQLKYPIRRYITAPGRVEIKIYESLKELGKTLNFPGMNYQIELWPNLDAYDIRVVFPDNKVWAVDVKDWTSPYRLAQKVGSFRLVPPWDKAFFVFPDRYKKLRYNYLEAFKHRCIYLDERVDATYESDFLSLVEQNLKDLYEKYK